MFSFPLFIDLHVSINTSLLKNKHKNEECTQSGCGTSTSAVAVFQDTFFSVKWKRKRKEEIRRCFQLYDFLHIFFFCLPVFFLFLWNFLCNAKWYGISISFYVLVRIYTFFLSSFSSFVLTCFTPHIDIKVDK